MCGIVGVIGGGDRGMASMEAALGCLRHRGPDAQESMRAGVSHLGHTLLSIIGREPVIQPLRADGSPAVALTFNGEIYNYLELRDEDDRIKAVTSGSSDTEVLLAGLEIYGIEFLAKLNGMFAFCFTDANGDAYLVRDRLGIKPLLYREDHGEVAFASEHEALGRMANTSREPDPFGWYSYVRARYPLDGASFDVGIRMVPPGHYLRVRQGRSSLHQYWRIELADELRDSDEDMLARTSELLEDSVRLRMRSDHSFCTFLSGGLDSSLLSAFAADAVPDLQTYSVGVDAEGFDESAHAAKVAQVLGTRHVELRLGVEGFMAQASRLWDELRVPLGVPNVVAIAALAEEMSKAHRCVLSGEGADEVFGGYGGIFLMPHDWAARSAPDASSVIVQGFQRIYGDIAPRDFESLFIERYSYLDHGEAIEALAPMFSPSEFAECRDRYDSVIRAEFAETADGDAFGRLLIVFQRLHLPGLLTRLDTATMAHSVEARVPFLDHRIVEYANSLPMDFKMRRRSSWSYAVDRGALSDGLSEVHDIPKWPLRQVAKSMIPDDIIGRRKLGFPIPPAFYGSAEEAALRGYGAWVDVNVSEVRRRIG